MYSPPSAHPTCGALVCGYHFLPPFFPPRLPHHQHHHRRHHHHHRHHVVEPIPLRAFGPPHRHIMSLCFVPGINGSRGQTAAQREAKQRRATQTRASPRCSERCNKKTQQDGKMKGSVSSQWAARWKKRTPRCMSLANRIAAIETGEPKPPQPQ